MRARLSLAPRRQRNDVVQQFRPGFKKAPDIASRLSNALLVFHECDADMAFTMFAKASPGSDRNAGLLDQKRGEFDAAEGAERLGYRRPSEHRGRGRRHWPASTAERLHQRVAAAPIGRAHLVDAEVRPVERRGG